MNMEFTSGQLIEARCSESGRRTHPAKVIAWNPAHPDTVYVRWTDRRHDAADSEAYILRR